MTRDPRSPGGTSAQPQPRADVLVVVPARDEALSIEACLSAVVRALDHARGLGAVGRTRLAVAAHLCTDHTAQIASDVLDEAGVDHLVVVDATSETVGQVRHQLVETAVAVRPLLDLASTWVLSTDADTTVPTDWVTGLLDVAHLEHADLVAGFVDLDDTWQHAPLAARQAYDQLIRAGLEPHVEHQHVWAANLAVRLPAYLRAGGFPFVPHGEERELRDAVARTGTVTASLVPCVTTSARTPGRASHGLGELLAQLTAHAES